jgi:hypothetical protein
MRTARAADLHHRRIIAQRACVRFASFALLGLP